MAARLIVSGPAQDDIGMVLGGQADRLRNARGYAMAALLVAIGVMSVMLTVALPAWRQATKRGKEAELIFRGEHQHSDSFQYMDIFLVCRKDLFEIQLLYINGKICNLQATKER